jgi:hypothetical protein
MEANIKLNEFEFPWKVLISKDKKNYKHLDEVIRQCEQDQAAIQKEKINVSDIEKLFIDNDSVFVFVHESQFMFNPVYCILWDISTPTEHALLNEVVLAISRKFISSNFEGEEEAKFHNLLYSVENQERLKRFGLIIAPICSYEY